MSYAVSAFQTLVRQLMLFTFCRHLKVSVSRKSSFSEFYINWLNLISWHTCKFCFLNNQKHNTRRSCHNNQTYQQNRKLQAVVFPVYWTSNPIARVLYVFTVTEHIHSPLFSLCSFWQRALLKEMLTFFSYLLPSYLPTLSMLGIFYEDKLVSIAAKIIDGHFNIRLLWQTLWQL